MNVTIKDLLEAGVHFGHQTKRWNPKMKKFIFTSRSGIYILDLQKTLKCLEIACQKVREVVASGKGILFVGTKKQAQEVVREQALRSGAFYVTEIWLGGMLTNFQTIKLNIKRLREIERMKEDGTYEKLTKKEGLKLEKERMKLEKVLGGIKEMNRLPGLLYVVDAKKERIAVAEGSKLGIPIIAIIDTNSDPDPITFPIAANDDAIKSIRVITQQVAEAASEAEKSKEEKKDIQEKVET
ncbi:MAG: 30S ribosomal protein S2 [Candidatus Zixiibacteriota bacterium]|nr:MAG: 30S ribosomal protein S2 [candidate division Zixibacteria bacterium]